MQEPLEWQLQRVLQSAVRTAAIPACSSRDRNDPLGDRDQALQRGGRIEAAQAHEPETERPDREVQVREFYSQRTRCSVVVQSPGAKRSVHGQRQDAPPYVQTTRHDDASRPRSRSGQTV